MFNNRVAGDYEWIGECLKDWSAEGRVIAIEHPVCSLDTVFMFIFLIINISNALITLAVANMCYALEPHISSSIKQVDQLPT